MCVWLITLEGSKDLSPRLLCFSKVIYFPSLPSIVFAHTKVSNTILFPLFNQSISQSICQSISQFGTKTNYVLKSYI